MFKLLTSVEDKRNDEFSEEIVCHLLQLKKEFMHYFPDVTSCICSINPFFVDPADLPVGTGKQKELIIGIQTDEAAKIKHMEYGCPINFWLSTELSYPNIATHAVPQLLIFPSTSVREQGFSALMSIKSKSQNRLAAPGHDFRCAVSKVSSRIDQSMEKKTTSFFLLKQLLCFQSFFSFFQLWADASLIITLFLSISEQFNYPNIVVRKFSMKPSYGTRVEKVWEALLHSIYDQYFALRYSERLQSIRILGMDRKSILMIGVKLTQSQS